MRAEKSLQGQGIVLKPCAHAAFRGPVQRAGCHKESCLVLPQAVGIETRSLALWDRIHALPVQAGQLAQHRACAAQPLEAEDTHERYGEIDSGVQVLALGAENFPADYGNVIPLRGKSLAPAADLVLQIEVFQSGRGISACRIFAAEDRDSSGIRERRGCVHISSRWLSAGEASFSSPR